MHRALWLGLGVLLASGPALASASGNVDDEIALLQRGIDRANANDCKAAVPPLKEAAEASAFGQLTGQQQYIAYRVLAGCSFDLRDYATAMKMSRQATSITAFADKSDWYMRLLASYVGDDKEDASVSLAEIVRLGPDVLSDLKVSALYRIIDDVAGTPAGDARNAKILQGLFDSGWRPADETSDALDGLWRRHARNLIAAGKLAEARKIVATITDPSEIVTIKADKAFDPIVTAAPGKFDILKAYQAAAVRAKAWMAGHPKQIEAVISYTSMLYKLDRQEEALALIDATLAKVKAGEKFTDAGDQLNWLHDRRASVLMALGRVEESLAAMKAGSAIGEDGNNVSQMINLAGMDCLANRPADSLKALEKFDPKNASPFGVMAMENSRICALAELKDQAAIAKSLAYQRAHADDAPALLIDSLLTVGEENEAAAAAVKYLGNVAKRDDILARLHTGQLPAKGADLAMSRVLRARWEALGKRPEVVAAVESFGHILKLPVVDW